MCIENGVNGLLIPINNEQALTEAMEQLIKNQDKLLQISEAAVGIRDRFSVDKVSAIWLENMVNGSVRPN